MTATIQRRTKATAPFRKNPNTILSELGLSKVSLNKEQRDVILMIERCIEISTEERDKPAFEWTPAGTLYANS